MKKVGIFKKKKRSNQKPNLQAQTCGPRSPAARIRHVLLSAASCAVATCREESLPSQAARPHGDTTCWLRTPQQPTSSHAPDSSAPPPARLSTPSATRQASEAPLAHSPDAACHSPGTSAECPPRAEWNANQGVTRVPFSAEKMAFLHDSQCTTSPILHYK